MHTHPYTHKKRKENITHLDRWDNWHCSCNVHQKNNKKPKKLNQQQQQKNYIHTLVFWPQCNQNFFSLSLSSLQPVFTELTEMKLGKVMTPWQCYSMRLRYWPPTWCMPCQPMLTWELYCQLLCIIEDVRWYMYVLNVEETFMPVSALILSLIGCWQWSTEGLW